MVAGEKLDPNTLMAGRDFLRRVAADHDLEAVWLFGSRARGDNRHDSDVDLAVVLMREPTDREALTMAFAGIAVDVLVDTGLLVQAIPFGPEDFLHPERSSNPSLIITIQEQGIRL